MDVNARNTAGLTPFDLCGLCGHAEVGEVVQGKGGVLGTELATVVEPTGEFEWQAMLDQFGSETWWLQLLFMRLRFTGTSGFRLYTGPV